MEESDYIKRASFPRFVHKESPAFFYYHAIYGFLLLIILVWVLNYVFWENETISKVVEKCLILGFAIYTFAAIVSRKVMEPIHGRFSSSIEFCRDRVTIAGTEVVISDIKTIRLVLGHYYKQKNSRSKPSIYPLIYNGNDNFIEIEKFNGDKLQAYFHISYESEFDEKMNDLLQHYKSQGKFLFLG